MKGLFEEIRRLLELGEELVLVTVISGSGSTPRGAGARMIVRRDGTTLGTIGGGAVEYQATRMGMEVIRDRTSHTHGFRLVKGQAADLGMICGGDVVVYFQYVSPADEAFRQVCLQALAALDRDEDSWIITDITDETAWAMGIISRGTGLVGMELSEEGTGALMAAKAVTVQLGARRLYSEPLVQSGRVYVFGGGHVAQELVPVLCHLDFRCTVYDDREEFANERLFPDAEETIVGSFEELSGCLEIRKEDYIVIMTRGHQCDYVVQRQALRTQARYIGVMGSRKKLATLAAQLLEEGFTEEDISRFHGPIGLPIQAETPAEIAVSVAAELIAVRAAGKRS